MSTGFSDFDDDFGKAPVKPKYASEATKQLADGDHECQVTLGVMKDDEKFGPRVTILMTVLGGANSGWSIEKSYFLMKKDEDDPTARVKDEKKLAELKTDLTTMGFDVANWTGANKRPFTKELTIACTVMKGVKLKVRKKQNGEHANLYLNKRLDDDRPKTFGPAEMAAEAGQEQFSPSGLESEGSTGAGQPGDPIPF